MALNNLRMAMQQSLGRSSKKYSVSAGSRQFNTLDVTEPKPFVFHVKLNRPKNLNAINKTMWLDLKQCFNSLADNSDCRVIILSGAGKLFNAGIDLTDMAGIAQELVEHEDVARKCKITQKLIEMCQDSVTAIEKCPKPVIAAVHGACIGGGVDMISAADIRYCTVDAWFQIKEVALGLAADVGTLQRFPKVIGSDSLVRELVYTARKFPAKEALESGFVNRIFKDQDSLLAESLSIAEDIAAKSPVAVQGSKLSLIYSRDHSVAEGLEHIKLYNQTMLQSEDLTNATMSQIAKGDAPVFSKL